MPELPEVTVAERLLQFTQEGDSRSRDADAHDAAVVGRAVPIDEAALLQFVEQGRGDPAHFLQAALEHFIDFRGRAGVFEVLELAEKKAKAEEARCKAIDGGIPVPDISRATYGEK